ncbi:HAMP domain-containing protein [Thiomicrospira microaerophila]|uniref:methyl-accepting chemotaxis protein n=1 Tax=Thiomicrospira microaerophila TaxID=406020 RepID=UPI00200EF47E|nr:methyl-accepting chemotaxis protein [Thiomicrospira microaerophila]UQB42113.1 HAMP domain-containing protein [Thiomicrospira microaerophila]
MRNHSLKTKIILATLGVTTLVVAAVALTLYLSQIKPLAGQIEQNLTNEMSTFMDSQIELKIQSGIIGATMMSQQPMTLNALNQRNDRALRQVLAGQQAHYSSVSNFRGIFSEILDAQGQSLLRSWNLDTPGANQANNELIRNVMQQKKANGALGFTERGVAITSVTPVLNQSKDLIGLVTMVQGVGSISRDFERLVGGSWIMLVDRNYVQTTQGHTRAIDNLNPINNRYVIANNSWFKEEVVNLTKNLYQQLDGDQSQVYLKNGHVVVDLPAYDEAGRVFGRQLFIQDESVYTSVLAQAHNQAWITLAGVVFGILLLAAILLLLVNRLVITPLQQLNVTMADIQKTGNFSLRVAVKSNDEVGQTAQAINEHLTQVSQAMNQTGEAIAALAKGDLSKRIKGEFVGDLLTIKNGVNSSADNVQKMIEQVATAMAKLSAGDFNYKTNLSAEGAFAEILDNTSRAMSDLNHIMQDINNTMSEMAQGRFQQRIEAQAQGDLNSLKQKVNQSLEKLDEVIRDIAGVMQAQSSGDLTLRVAVDCEGDLDRLKTAINENAERLSQIINDVLIAADTVYGAAEEVSHGSDSLSESVQQQAASVEQTSATMTEITSAIDNNAQNAKNADKLEHALETNSQTAAKVMRDTIQAMSAIQDSSNQINDIVSLIDGIAFQTNLLALNAAVEAARAGEHGRGFAVVAGEVRSLAQKSAEAAKDIKSLIEKSVERINQGTQLAAESEEIISKMNQSITEVTGMIADIASASVEQAQGVSEINQAIGLIDNVTQQNAALVEETSAAAESLKDQAKLLSESVSFFKTKAHKGLGFKG